MQNIMTIFSTADVTGYKVTIRLRDPRPLAGFASVDQWIVGGMAP